MKTQLIVDDAQKIAATNAGVDPALLRSLAVLAKQIPKQPTGLQYSLMRPVVEGTVSIGPTLRSQNRSLDPSKED